MMICEEKSYPPAHSTACSQYSITRPPHIATMSLAPDPPTQLAQITVREIAHQIFHLGTRELWTANREEQKRLCSARMARLTEALVGMIGNLCGERVRPEKRTGLMELINEPRQFDVEIIACNGFDELSRYFLIAMKDLRACYAEGAIAFGRQVELGEECWDLCDQLRSLPDPGPDFLPLHNAEESPAEDSVDSVGSHQHQMLEGRLCDVAAEFRETSGKIAAVQDRMLWIEANLGMDYDDQGRIWVE